MMINRELLTGVEQLRILFDDQNGTKDRKDWYHFILIDLQKKVRVLANVALIGKPEEGELQATFIAHLPVEQTLSPLSVNSSIATWGTAFSQP